MIKNYFLSCAMGHPIYKCRSNCLANSLSKQLVSASLPIGRGILKSRMNREVHIRFCEEQGGENCLAYPTIGSLFYAILVVTYPFSIFTKSSLMKSCKCLEAKCSLKEFSSIKHSQIIIFVGSSFDW